MLFVPTFVGTSKIHGLGLFAAERIAIGTLVSRWTTGWDVSFEADEVEGLPILAKTFVNHFGWQQGNTWYVSLDNSRYINHSIERANLRVRSEGGMEALRDIEQGEELLENYESYCSA